jgi:hypothetical protein
MGSRAASRKAGHDDVSPGQCRRVSLRLAVMGDGGVLAAENFYRSDADREQRQGSRAETWVRLHYRQRCVN